MLIETDVGIDLTNTSILGDAIGVTWTTFEQSMTPEQKALINYGANLVFINYPESDLGIMVNEIIVDENLAGNNKIMVVRNIIRDNLLEIAQKLGFELDGDYTSDDAYYVELIKLIDFVFEVDKLEDVSGMCSLLESQDINPKERYIGCLQKHYGEDFEVDKLNYLITDVSEATLERIKLGLLSLDDDVEPLPDYIKNRILNNRELIKPTLAGSHITNGGAIGLAIDSLLAFFKRELSDQLENDWFIYAQNIIGMYLISDTNNDGLTEKLISKLKDVPEGMLEYAKLENLIKEIKL